MTQHNGLKRRSLLKLTAVAGVSAAGLAAAGCSVSTERAGKVLTSDLKLPPAFEVPLPIPATAQPTGTDGDADRYELTQRPDRVEIIPGTTTQVWGYDGTFPGPTFDVRRGRPIVVSIANKLDVPTSTHLHGGVTPAESDGFPTDLTIPVGDGGKFTPATHSHMEIDESVWTFHDGHRDYRYPLDQPAATLWYHDHRMDFTAPQVWRGLAGFFIIRDEKEDALGLPKGDKDIPLMLCDRAFHSDGSFKYPAVDGTLLGAPGVTGEYHQGVEGDVILVNGAPWPVMEVADTRYRFRILNASNARRFELALDAPEASFTQVGSDVGLLHSPLVRDDLVLSPAERNDVIIDFSKYPIGTELTLLNRLGTDRDGEVMRFRVSRTETDDSVVPEVLSDHEVLREADVVGDRKFAFALTDTDHGQLWTINGKPYDPAGSLASIKLDTVERWTFTSDFHHPVHLHLGHFEVLSRNGKPILDSDEGRKDTVDLRPYEVVEVLVRFSGYRGRYMMHCHNLEHEDMAMMANFDVV